MSDDNNDIVKRLQQGEELAYKELFDRFYINLCIIAKEYVKDKFTAEEIVEEVFFKIWENRKEFNINNSLKAYLVKAVHNGSLNYLARLKVEQKLKSGLSAQISNNEHFIPFTDSYPIANLYVSELENKINLSVESLPTQCKEIFCLSRYDELKYEEIALKLDISVNTVKTQIKIALGKLRESLRENINQVLLIYNIRIKKNLQSKSRLNSPKDKTYSK
jgi:RNA polymerase sigma-70 factor, ECF subfamily